MLLDEIGSAGKSMEARIGTLRSWQAWVKSLGIAPLKSLALVLALSLGGLVWQLEDPGPVKKPSGAASAYKTWISLAVNEVSAWDQGELDVHGPRNTTGTDLG